MSLSSVFPYQDREVSYLLVFKPDSVCKSKSGTSPVVRPETVCAYSANALLPVPIMQSVLWGVFLSKINSLLVKP